MVNVIFSSGMLVVAKAHLEKSSVCILLLLLVWMVFEERGVMEGTAKYCEGEDT